MKKQHTFLQKEISRRSFITTSAKAAAGFYIVPRHVLGRGFTAPSDMLNVAAIGVGGKGHDDLGGLSKGTTNIAGLCDVDDRQAKWAWEKWPKAARYKDFRRMFDQEKGIDAVTVSTPDHTHAVAAMAAMQLGKHVYVQKPMTHDIYEARKLTEAAKRYKVVTQMGNQGGSYDGVRRMKEWYEAGLIGAVNRVECWTNRPVWPQGVPSPTGKFDVPAELDWNLWLGTAPQKDYNPAYHPFNWRGWVDYGTGALGDMACHIIDQPYRILGLGYPSEVECRVSSVYGDFFKESFYNEGFPAASVINLTFPRAGKKDLKLNWYDGGMKPERPDWVGPNEKMGGWDGGTMMIGEKGIIMCDILSEHPRVFPESLREAAEKVPVTLPRVPEGHYIQWIEGAKAGYGKTTLSSSFDFAGPMTEAILMGNLAIRSYNNQVKTGNATDYPGRKKLLWDGANMKITNYDEANQYVRRTYAPGWSI